ncbi:MAG TPA: NEW3 domain-containing protein, partial [Sedimentisphaerales bacterium]|nr:NEW3 domain-containing protein [Sedimentisphaerales bacterium]
RFGPYGSKARPGRTVQVSLKTFNHSSTSRKLTFALNLPAGFEATPPTASVTIPPRTEKQTDFNLAIDTSVDPGTYVITADVQQEQWNLPRWAETIIEVE